MTPKIDIVISAKFPVSYRGLLRKAALETVKGITKRPVSLSVSVVGIRKIQELNRKFRGKNKPTDVLSFPSASVPGSDFVGDVVLCWEIAKNQTKTFGTTPRQEVQRLTVHGVLHLFGYDHETSAKDAKKMFTLQERILKRLD